MTSILPQQNIATVRLQPAAIQYRRYVKMSTLLDVVPLFIDTFQEALNKH